MVVTKYREHTCKRMKSRCRYWNGDSDPDGTGSTTTAGRGEPSPDAGGQRLNSTVPNNSTGRSGLPGRRSRTISARAGWRLLLLLLLALKTRPLQRASSSFSPGAVSVDHTSPTCRYLTFLTKYPKFRSTKKSTCSTDRPLYISLFGKKKKRGWLALCL